MRPLHSGRWCRLLLSLRVHADAFRFDPIGYLQGITWRARGLKLRSRHRFAALTGRSRHAYALWIARDEPRVFAGLQGEARSTGLIRLIIDCRASRAGLEETLFSLDPETRNSVVTIGGPAGAGTFRIAHPRDLAALAANSDIWLCPLHAGERLAPNAAAIYEAAVIGSAETSIIYADDDLVGPDGRRHSPHLKPNWNPELFRHHDFISGAGVVRAGADILSALPDQNWQRALVEKALATGTIPKHLRCVLHHRLERPAPCVPDKPASSQLGPAPAITIIVPTRNKVDLLRTCMEGLGRTAYPSMDIIVVDNGSHEPEALAYLKSLEFEGVTVMRIEGAFNFSALNNAAARLARGDLLCFLNNDVEILDSDWLEILVCQAVRSDIGAVGARLLYPDGTIQHAGVCIGIGGGAGHAHRFQREDDPGYFERSRLPQQISAVTAACLVVAREKFFAVGGFNERDFPVAFNDVDLCLKLNDRGWQSFYEPRATLIHHESKSRGNDRARPNRSRFAAELAALKQKWHTDTEQDPYHHPYLSRFCEQFVIAL